MPNISILQATASQHDSYIWKGICKAKDMLKDGLSLRIGSGNSSLWYSIWSELGKICDLVDYVHISNSTLQVKDIWINGAWSFNNLATSIPNNIKEVIQRIPIPKICQIEDTWCWNKSTDGCYSVKAEVWSRLGWIAHSDFISSSFMDWFLMFATGSDGVKFMIIYWWLWRWRNSFIFDPVPWPIDQVLRNIHFWFEECALQIPASPINMAVPRLVRWQPPGAGLVKVNVDGNCFISSGLCGAGGLLRGSDGQWLAGISMNLAILWKLLDFACYLTFLCTIIADIHQLIRRSTSCLISHVLREGNASADLLAKHGVSQVDSFKLWHEPPPFLGSALLADSMGITFLR
ncbi:putative ribonuclease H protein [Sesbania bispinosa]|nr:putative ribonuclease H protein [Sesbania bispinosa]